MGSLRPNYKGVKKEIFNIISNNCLHSFVYLHIQQYIPKVTKEITKIKILHINKKESWNI